MDILTKDITKELGLDNLPDDKKEETLLRIGNIIYQGVMIRVVEILGEEDQNELGKLMDEIDPKKDESDKVLEFLRAKIENFDDMVADEVRKFKEESLEVMQSIKK